MKPNEIIIHCSDTPTGRAVSASDIHSWHLQRGWNGIGYHWIIGIDGKLEQGRPEYWQGSHCKGHNFNTLGVCLIGRGEYTELQELTLATLVHSIRQRHDIKSIKGHNEYDTNKTCPMFDVQEWVEDCGIKL